MQGNTLGSSGTRQWSVGEAPGDGVVVGRLSVVHQFQVLADEVLGSASLADSVGGRLARSIRAPEDAWDSAVSSELANMRYRAMKCQEMWGVDASEGIRRLEEVVESAR